MSSENLIDDFEINPPFSLYANVNCRTFDEGFSSVCSILSKSNNILVLAGAGMSVSCGIPDFRSKDGIYSTIDLEVNKIFFFLLSQQITFNSHNTRTLN